MMQKSKNRLTFICLTFFCVLFCSNNSFGQFFEVYAIGQQMLGDNTTAEGKKLELSNNFGGGIGAGLNISNVNLNMDFIFGSTEIRMEDRKLDSKLFLFDANLDYYFFNFIIQPMVTAGIGSVNFSDSFVKIENLSESDFSYNVGIGAKWVIAGNYLLKGMYRATWTKIKNTDSSIMLNGISFSIGYVF